jgi:hypothetical protein
MRFLASLAAAAFGLASLAAPATAQTPVRVGIIPVLGVSPLLILQNEGWAKQAGLDLKITTFESGPLMIQALASGTLDVYVAGVAPLGAAHEHRGRQALGPPFALLAHYVLRDEPRAALLAPVRALLRERLRRADRMPESHERLDRDRYGTERGHKNVGKVWQGLANLAQELYAVHLRKFKVRENAIDVLRGEDRKRFLSARRA